MSKKTEKKQKPNLVDQYLGNLDWRVKENSNNGDPTFSGLMLYLANSEIAKHALKNIYPEEIANAHREGDIHIHDLSYSQTFYCSGWSLSTLIKEGINKIPGKASSAPAKHLSSLMIQMVNFLGCLQMESAGAQAFNNVDTHLAPFVKNDNLSFDQVKQFMQQLIFNLNIPSRWGSQSVFSNFTFDIICPKDMENKLAVVGGKEQEFTYGDCQSEMDMLNQAFIEVMEEGDSDGQIHTFPIPTYNIDKNFDWNSPVVDKLFSMTAKYGVPYFANFVNSDLDASQVKSMCCRIRLELGELRKRNGGYFGSGDNVGCYDEKTELLTDRGWIFFKDLTYDDYIYTLTDNNKIEKHKPLNIFEYDWAGDMYQFKNTSFNLLVTPNHRMLCENKHSKERKFIRADEFNGNSCPIPKKAEWNGIYKENFILPSIENNWISGNYNSKQHYKKEEVNINMDLWLKFLGLYISEGCCDNENIAKSHGYRVTITQKTHKEKVEEILNLMPYKYRTEIRNDCNNYIICNKQLWSYLKQFGKSYDKFIPFEIKQLPKEQLEILFEYLILGDGTTRKNPLKSGEYQKVYYTTSKRLADDISEIIIKLGYMANIRVRNRGEIRIKGRVHKTRNCYEITVNYSNSFLVKNHNINKVYYNGKVYCCEVCNNSMLVRRNGKITWCGNSIGVVTINLPRIGYLSKSIPEFFERLDKFLLLAKESLDIKRKIINKNYDNGLMPYTKRYLTAKFINHFSTIGIVGMNECLLNFMGKDIGTEEGNEFAIQILDYINRKLSEFQRTSPDKILYNLEATPAEGTSYRLAKIDKEKHPEIITASEEVPYYTNSVHLPVDYTDDIFKVLELEDELQTKFTSGTVIHFYLGEQIENPELLKKLTKKIVQNYQLPYFSFTPTFSTCIDCGYIKGEEYNCPTCGKETLVWSRVTGYLRPVQNFNKGKEEEFKKRKTYRLGDK